MSEPAKILKIEIVTDPIWRPSFETSYIGVPEKQYQQEQKELTDLRAENEKMRKALKEILDMQLILVPAGYVVWEKCAAIAKAALNSESQKEKSEP